MTKRRTAAEIIGFHLGWDIREVSDCRYQPTRYARPAIYALDALRYGAAPSDNRPPKAEVGAPWREVATYYGRKVFIADGEEESDA